MVSLSRETTRRVAAAWGAARVGLGAFAMFAPRTATAVWVGPNTHEPAGAVLGRALGGRDVGLGAGVLVGALGNRPLRTWVLAGGAADAVDGIATLCARSRLPRGRRDLVAFASIGSSLLAVLLGTRVDT